MPVYVSEIVCQLASIVTDCNPGCVSGRSLFEC